jgi:hypothetical protein
MNILVMVFGMQMLNATELMEVSLEEKLLNLEETTELDMLSLIDINKF